MCSKRCAKPVRPGFSFLDPTWNHWFTCTIGSLRSTCRMTWSPFGSVYFSNSILGTDEGDAEAAGAGAWPEAVADRANRAESQRAADLRNFTFLLVVPSETQFDPRGSNVDTDGRFRGFGASRC